MVCFVKYRSKIEVVADVLSAALEGAKKTHIMYRGNLSFRLVNAYLSVATRAGLISFDDESGFYSATEKGKLFLDRFKRYKRLTRSLERQLGQVKSEIASLEQMCLAGNLPGNNDFNSENDSENNSKSGCDKGRVVHGRGGGDSVEQERGCR